MLHFATLCVQAYMVAHLRRCVILSTLIVFDWSTSAATTPSRNSQWSNICLCVQMHVFRVSHASTRKLHLFSHSLSAHIPSTAAFAPHNRMELQTAIAECSKLSLHGDSVLTRTVAHNCTLTRTRTCTHTHTDTHTRTHTYTYKAIGARALVHTRLFGVWFRFLFSSKQMRDSLCDILCRVLF